MAKLQKHFACDVTAIQDFRFDSLKDPASQCRHLLYEFWPKPVVLEILKSLEVSFLLGRADHGVAITILEEVKNQPSDPVLLLNIIRRAFLLLQGVLKVFLRVNLVPISV